MGQKNSTIKTKPKLSLTWVLRNQPKPVPTPEPIKLQYKARRRSVESTRENCIKKDRQSPNYEPKIRNGEVPVRTKSEPNLNSDRNREKHRHRKRNSRISKQGKDKRFGYEIQDVDAFLTKVYINYQINLFCRKLHNFSSPET